MLILDQTRANGVLVCLGKALGVEAIHHSQSSPTARLVLCLSDKLLRAHYANSNEGGHSIAISILREARIGVDRDL